MDRKKIKVTLILLTVVLLGLAVVIFLFPKKLIANTSSPGGETESHSSAEGDVETEVAVEVGQIVQTNLYRHINAYGQVEPEPPAGDKKGARAVVCSPVGGLLEEILVKEGQAVKEGQILFRLDSRRAKIAVEKAEKELIFAKQNYDRQKELLTAEATPLKNVQEAESLLRQAEDNLTAAKTELSYMEIKSPLNGLVTKVEVVPGQTVDSSKSLAEIVDLSRLVISAKVPSSYAKWLQIGQEAEIAPDSKIRAKLVFISPNIDPQTDTVLVRLSLPPDSGLNPGKFVSLKIVGEVHRDCLAVPIESLVRQKEKEYISVVENGYAIRKQVTSGLRDQGLVEISGQGLKAGQTVVTIGAYALPEKTKIRILGK